MTAAAHRNPGLSLGINGLGRIGKLTLWHHISRKYFGRVVVNLGRTAGGSLFDLVHYIERDSTYGSLQCFLHGHRAEPVIDQVDEAQNLIVVDGVEVKVLTEARNPKDIDWAG
ncbi:MAG: glyceraldehyde-3-phosphate dehydrogenase, partial [Deltaproteobacteria bacterium]|nr:glyceraldehyde-3-phosphate dehydrogenase [Deltaproteobacteria bacterium]